MQPDIVVDMDSSTVGPTVAEKQSLCEALQRHFTSRRAPRRVAIVRFLFSESIENQRKGMPDEAIKADQLTRACWPQGTPKDQDKGDQDKKDQDNNVAATMSRLYDELDVFFQSKDGALHPWRIIRPMLKGDRGNFVLSFERNVQPAPAPGPPPADDLADSFWRPYVGAPQPVHILYPELRSMMDANETYFRNPYWDKPRLLKHLKLKNTDVQLSYSFVSSGLVAGMLSIIGYLNRYPDFRFKIAVIRPHDTMAVIPDDRNCILFGTPTSTQLLTNLEMSAIRTGKKRVVVRTESDVAERHQDGSHRQDDAVIQTKFGVLTRRRHPTAKNSVITLLAGNHGRAIEAMASFLVNENEMSQFGRICRDGNAFPAQFQVLFKVGLSKARDTPPVVLRTELTKVIVDRSGKAKRKTNARSR